MRSGALVRQSRGRSAVGEVLVVLLSKFIEPQQHHNHVTTTTVSQYTPATTGNHQKGLHYKRYACLWWVVGRLLHAGAGPSER